MKIKNKNNIITSLVIGESVTSIGDFAFAFNQLTSVTIPDNVSNLGSAVLLYNDQFTNYYVSEDNMNFTVVDSVLFNKSMTVLVDMPSGDIRESYIIPESVTVIGDQAFNHSHLTSVTIGNNVTVIGEYGLCDNQLTSVTIPESVMTIGKRAFYLNQLTSVTILGDSTRFNPSWDIIGFSAVPAP